jgi:hypothetical protein
MTAWVASGVAAVREKAPSGCELDDNEVRHRLGAGEVHVAHRRPGREVAG